MLPTRQAPQQLLDLAVNTVNDPEKLESLHKHILQLALPDSAEIIAKEVIRLAENGD